MTKRIFNGIFFTSIIVMLACLVFVIGVQYQFYAESQIDALKSKAILVKAAFEADEDYLKSVNNSGVRITLIDENGTVLFDNTVSAASMENHLDRKEIAAAAESGDGTAVRYSDTVATETCYYAIKLADGRFLRVSDERLTVLAMLPQLLQPICAVAIGSVIISLVFASLISKRILKPINEIDVESPEIDNKYDELSPLINKIKLQNNRIRSQIIRLDRSRLQFKIISDNMSEGLVITDKTGHILSCNRSVQDFFGASENLDGKNILTLNRSSAFREVMDALSQGKHSNEMLQVDKKVFEITGNPVFDDENKLCGAVILVVDVTEKENREKLRREFTANISHELKTPLTSIYGISDMLRSGMVNDCDIKGFADDINKESGRLINLVNDIIRLSQLDEEKMPDETSDVDLCAVATDVCERLKSIAEKSGIKIVKNLSDAKINASASLLFEMIYNLCDNAIKYNKPDGTVFVITGTQNGRAFICVKDTGIGIEKDDFDRIFERFYRVDKSRSKQIGGTGLGLSIVKHIAAVTDGEIAIESTPGLGTEIKVSY